MVLPMTLNQKQRTQSLRRSGILHARVRLLYVLELAVFLSRTVLGVPVANPPSPSSLPAAPIGGGRGSNEHGWKNRKWGPEVYKISCGFILYLMVKEQVSVPFTLFKRNRENPYIISCLKITKLFILSILFLLVMNCLCSLTTERLSQRLVEIATQACTSNLI